MNRVIWFEKKFIFNLDQNEYGKVLKKLGETPDRIGDLVTSLPGEILIIKPEGKWSIKENVGHLFDLEELHIGRINDFIAGKDVLRPADLANKKTNEAKHNERDIKGLLKVFREARENFVKRISELDETALKRVSIHPRLNQPMRPIDMAQFILEHDEHHIQTIKEIIEKYSPS